MSHIADLEVLEAGLVAVGWLHPDHQFPQADVPPEFLAKLRGFVEKWGDSIDALNWGAGGGYHTCEFCGQAWGSGTFGVPAGERVFYAPEMIAHYVEKHGYAPPPEFIVAVLSCPLPGTPEYTEAVAPFTRQANVAQVDGAAIRCPAT
jgi:hypothetical protein